MIIVHDPLCADYGSSMRPEQPARITRSVAHLKAQHPGWTWRVPVAASEDLLRLAHTEDHLQQLTEPFDFDADTPFFAGIKDHARRSVGGALLAAEIAAASGAPVISLMRPPGHHAAASEAMGFCYLNSIAIAAIAAQKSGPATNSQALTRIAVWDFDAHHGNGTEAILQGRPGFLFTSVHQSPCYPGTGTISAANCFNWPVPPRVSRIQHLVALREAWDAVLSFEPQLILVSAGFDAYARDPITAMMLELEDFATLGSWLKATDIPAAAVLEGGYSPDLPLLIDGFLSAWDK